MNFFKLTLVTVSLLLIGCGSDSKNSSDKPNDTKVESVKDAQKNFKALTAFGGLGESIGQVTNSGNLKKQKILNKLQKEEKRSCKDGGTSSVVISEKETTIEMNFNQCKVNDSLQNGRIKFTDTKIEITEYTYSDTNGSGYINITMEEKTVNNILTTLMNGVINQKNSNGEINNMSVTNMKSVEKKTSPESWSTIDGSISIESKCFTGAYTFKTIEKLVQAKDGSENLESGILKLNSATYTFNNPDVTIKIGSSTETILQSDLEKRFEIETVCDE